MPRVSAPLVLLPAWLVMVACSPHSLRIGKCGLARGSAPIHYPGVHKGHESAAQDLGKPPSLCTVPSLSVAGVKMQVVGVEAADR